MTKSYFALRMQDVTRIVTHGGAAHRDEFLACCFALAVNPDVAISRRDPTALELDSPITLVLDVGMQHDPMKLNFDHHQLPRTADACCALTLVLAELRLLETAYTAYRWLRFTEVLDSKGPKAAAELVGTDWDRAQQTRSPIEGCMVRMFASRTFIPVGKTLHNLMCEIGVELLAYLQKFEARMAEHDAKTKVVLFTNGMKVIDASWIPSTDDPVLALEAWIKKRGHTDAAVTITADDRGPGLCLFRRDDHPRIDFSRIEGMPGVRFAHKSGFVAKVELGYSVDAFIRAATV